MVMNLKVENIKCGYGKKTVVEDISLNVKSGEILCLLGPNGVGKTTLFKSILGLLNIKGGKIFIDDENIDKLSSKELAKVIAYVPQAHTPPFPYSVLDVVVMGRTAHLGIFSSPKEEDYVMAEKIIDGLSISYLKDKIYTEISGGERQMVLIARALAQNPKILIMDEPTSNLDFGNQIRVLQSIKELSLKGIAVIMTSHFPDHAFLCCSKVALMRRNNKFNIGSVEEIITEDNLKSAYGIEVKITKTICENGNEIKSCVPLLA